MDPYRATVILRKSLNYLDQTDIDNHELDDVMEAIETLWDNCKWISVTVQLPEHYTNVIVARTTEDGRMVAEQGQLLQDGQWKIFGARTKSVRYWKPMPEPPDPFEYCEAVLARELRKLEEEEKDEGTKDHD